MAGVVGGYLYSHQPGKEPLLIGKINQCAAATQPKCEAAKNGTVCLFSSSASGAKLQAYAVTEWSAQWTWNISIGTTDRESNTLQSAPLIRPTNVPAGPFAGIVTYVARRDSPSSGSYTLVVYSPGIAGRRITKAVEAFVGGIRIWASTDVWDEIVGQHDLGEGGGIHLAAGEVTMVVTIQERDAAGSLLATESRTIILP